jgi:oligoribonuclease NrnB/cAMP/cGMP phosphodiesterase (DHH superfamily)
MKIKLFTHTDLDGIGPVVLLKVMYGPELELNYETHGYATIDQAVSDYYTSKEYLNYDYTYIIDISVREEHSINAVSNMFAEGHFIALLDHHATALPLNDYLWAKVDTEKPNCGTSLLFDCLTQDKELIPIAPIYVVLKEFVRLVQQWDTWLWADSGDDTPKKLNDLFYLYGKYDFADAMVNRISGGTELLIPVDFVALRTKKQIYQQYLAKKTKQLRVVASFAGDLTAGIVFADEYLSELGHDLLDAYPEISHIVMINPGTKTVSLRARTEDNVDVKAIAESHGGGGHTKASGYQLTQELVDKWIMQTL